MRLAALDPEPQKLQQTLCGGFGESTVVNQVMFAGMALDGIKLDFQIGLEANLSWLPKYPFLGP